MLKKFGHWVADYAYLFRGSMHMILQHEPPRHYLEFTLPHKNPVVLLPGIGSTWHFLRYIGDSLSHAGHPVYVVHELKFSLDEIPKLATIVNEFITKQNLTDVVLVGYSKGGLIGKYLLAFLNETGRVRKLVAIATPFEGSNIVRLVPSRRLSELHPENSLITELREKRDVNHSIVSIYGLWDNHIWPTTHAHLEGARNITVPVHGHHRIVFMKEVRDIVAREVDT